MTVQIVASNFSQRRVDRSWRYSCDVSGFGDAKSLWFDIRTVGTEPEAASLKDHALLSLIYPAMKAGKDLVIDGEISGPTLFVARDDLQKLLLTFDPSLHRIDIDAQPVWTSPQRVRNTMKVGTGFSAGVDSFAAVLSFQNARLDDQVRVTDLFVMNVGAFGSGMGQGIMRAFDQSVDRMIAYAALTDRSAHRVHSNLQLFDSGDGLTFSKTHTLRNLAAASLFHNELDLYLYASGVSYADLLIAGVKDIAYIDPVLIPMLAPMGMRFMGANAGLSRIEKTRLVASDRDAQRLLDVCVSPAGRKAAFAAKGMNCSDCTKCFRTMLTLDALGLLDRFTEVFDVPSYRSRVKVVAEAVRRRGEKGSAVDRAAYEAFMASESSAALL